MDKVSTHEIKAFQSLRRAFPRFSGAAETLKPPAVERSGDIGIKALQFIRRGENEKLSKSPCPSAKRSCK